MHYMKKVFSILTVFAMISQVCVSQNLTVNSNRDDNSITTLAAESRIDKKATRERFLAMGAGLPNSAVGHYIKERIDQEIERYGEAGDAYQRKARLWREARYESLNVTNESRTKKGLMGNISNDIPSHLREVHLLRLMGMFENTVQFGHLGLTVKDNNGNPIPGEAPVIYADQKYSTMAENALLKHEIDEAIQAKKFHIALADAKGVGVDEVDLRAWIDDHMDEADPDLNKDEPRYKEYKGKTAVQIWEGFHKNAYSLDELYKKVGADVDDSEALFEHVDLSYIGDLMELYSQDIGKTINIAAFSAQVDTPDTVPTANLNYLYGKYNMARSAFGDKIVFGTSGIRDFVAFLQSIKCYAVAKAIISFMKAKGYMDRDEIVFAGDLRPSTRHIMQTQLMAGHDWGKKVLCAGNLLTPAVAYYGMYRTEGAIPSVEITASHCPVLPLSKEQNGVKPNTKEGEVLKDDELEILKQVREFLELELMMRAEDNMFDNNGMLKKRSDLSNDQKGLVDHAIALMSEGTGKYDMAQTEAWTKATKMYVERYTEAFGKIFDETDEMAFLAHMAVGRNIVADIFRALGVGSGFHYTHEGGDWEEGLIVDTEDVKPKLKLRVQDIRGECQAAGRNIRGIFTTDGDSDRPALFTEDGQFIYGDKLGYMACEYLAHQESSKSKDKLAVMTASCSSVVERMLQNLGFEVVKVKIGSPYVVKAMQDWLKKHKNGLAVGFERNGGFLLGSDVRLDSGKTLKALATRDAVLPMIAAFHTAKMEEGVTTIGQLFDKRFSGDNACYIDSGLIDPRDVEEEPEYQNIPADAKQLIGQYTATLGQAIMRNYSPEQFDIVDVEFLREGKIRYKKLNQSKLREVGQGKIHKRMMRIKDDLEKLFNEDRGYKGGIAKMNFLDGVRMYFSNGEIAHMRPSGNSPQLRIYSEATTQERAEEITGHRLEIYPRLIEKYLEHKAEVANVRIVPRDNADMKKTFKGIKFPDRKVEQGVEEDWVTWKMKFGANSEHELTEGIVFADDNSKLTFYRDVIYDVKKGGLEWLPKEDFNKTKFWIHRNITWDRNEGTLTCTEKWEDGRENFVALKGADAWMELGRALDKNIPMGKIINRPFPVISERANNYFRQKGIMWLDLFDITIEPEITVEAPMWSHNFKFTDREVIDATPYAEQTVVLLDEEGNVRDQMEKGYTYDIRYDEARLKQYTSDAGLQGNAEPIKLLEAYVEAMNLRVPKSKGAKRVINLRPFNGEIEDGKRALISITAFNEETEIFGQGNVEMEMDDVINKLDPKKPLAIIRMLNMALASAHIPKDGDALDYPWIREYINIQYRAITRTNPPLGCDYKYITLPKVLPLSADDLQSYYETVIRQFRKAA